MLVIGETGCGKSTFINMITNFFRKGSFGNIRVAIPTKYHPKNESFVSVNSNTSSERNVDDVSQSQTDTCVSYDFEPGNHIHFRFIDSPGLGDTRGSKQDEINIGKILQAAGEEECITAIVVVINGSVPRELLGIKAAMVRFQGSIPDVVMNNMVAVFTNATKSSVNFPMKNLPFNPAAKYYMKNSAFSSDPNKWDAEDRQELEADFQSSLKTIETMLLRLSDFAAISSRDFRSIFELRNKVKEVLHKAQTDMMRLQHVLEQLNRAEESMKRHNSNAEQFQNYTQRKVIVSKELVDAPYHSTICSQCTSMCHKQCGLNEISQKGDNAFKNCAAFGGNDNCHVCKDRCSYTTHYHARKIVTETEENMDEILQDLKSKYDAAVAGQAESQTEIRTIEDAKAAVVHALEAMKQELESNCVDLKKICSRFNLAEELNITLLQMKREAEMMMNLKAKRDALAFVESLDVMVTTLNCGGAAALQKSLTHA